MKEYKVKMFGGALCLFFALMLPFVSLLGENDRAITAVQRYFENISLQKFSDNKKLYSKHYIDSVQSFADGITEQFSLETAVLNHFGVSPDSGYSIKAKKNRIWFPYIGNDSLQLSIQVVSQSESDSAWKKYLQFGSGKYLNNFITLIREDGRWKIDSIHIDGSEIENNYIKALEVMKSTSILSEKKDALILHEHTFFPSQMDPIEKRILTFQLNKVLTIINRSQ